jgi:lysophospholipase L1-like esterase
MRRGRVAFAIVALTTAAAPCLAAADLSRLVIVGDSVAAGFQCSGLAEHGQMRSFVAVLARQAGAPVSIPAIGAPGIPNQLILASWGPPPVIGTAEGVSPGRLDPLTQATNLAVPVQTVGDALRLRPDWPIDSLTDLVLGLPGLLGGVSMSQLEWAEALQPTTVLVWIGNNDVLWAMINADTRYLTPAESFAADYAVLMDRLTATGATIVVANIPDVATLPYVTRAEDVSFIYGIPMSIVRLALGVGPGDFVTMPGLDLVPPILRGEVPGPLPAGVVLDAGEVAVIQARTLLFNGIIDAEAARHGAALVDTNALLGQAARRGMPVCRQRLGTFFLGGVFTIDGIHPTDTAHGVIANAFIRTLNGTFGNAIPEADLCAIKAEDEFVNPRLSAPANPRGNRGMLRPRRR